MVHEWIVFERGPPYSLTSSIGKQIDVVHLVGEEYKIFDDTDKPGLYRNSLDSFYIVEF